MFKGWILDVYPSYEFDTMNVWLWSQEGLQHITDRFDPCFFVHGSSAELRECARKLADDDDIASISFTKRRLKLESGKKYEVLRIATRSFRRFKDLPPLINRWGGYSRLQLYDVDLRLAQKYMFEKGIFPMAYAGVGKTFRLKDDVFSMNYEVPPLRTVDLSITAGRGRVHGCDKNELPYASYDEPIRAVHLKKVREGERERGGEHETDRPTGLSADGLEGGDVLTIEADGGDERGLLLELAEAVDKLDADMIYSIHGDEVIFPYLYHRADKCGLGSNFSLDRDRTGNSGLAEIDDSGDDDDDAGPGQQGQPPIFSRRPEHRGKSYFTYGRIAYKPPFYSLKGRLHIDRSSSFIHRESGLFGLVELARLSSIPLQTMSRLSPGSAISAIQMGQAMREGMLIKWKKNQPELFKSATELLHADRGGHIFDPKAGVHDNVAELDFVSLYPTIIARKNISPETVLCGCCENKEGVPRVPDLGYHICTRRRGLIPKVIAPIIARRIAYKHRGGDANNARQQMLKWVLVTCFGYTGYRNARFGRIECHESITAYARDIMLDARDIAEEQGYEVLHGYVDSLWLKPVNGDHAAVEDVSRRISRQIGIPIELEGIYNWIVFLPNKSFDVGALTRYYGMFSDGTLKVRGIELRQHSTPPLFIRFQADVMDEFRKASNALELQGRLADVLELFCRYGMEIASGVCDTRDLVFNARISREIGEYRVFTNALAALRQLDDEGVEVHPGETVSYLIQNGASRNPYKRVKLADRLDGHEDYDRQKYLEFLCRAADSILRPFGYTEDVLAEYLERTTQTDLKQF